MAAELRLPEIGTDALLIGLVEGYAPLRQVPGLARMRPVDPEGGPGRVGGTFSIPVQAELEVERTLREVHWAEFGFGRTEAPRWTGQVRDALRFAVAIALAREAPWLGSDHLLEAIFEDAGSAARRLARWQRVDLERMTAVAGQLWPSFDGEPPRRLLAVMMRDLGVLADPGERGAGEAASSPGMRIRLLGAVLRLAAQASPALFLLEGEAVAETVRLGHDRTTLVHLVLAVLSLEEQMAATGLRAAGDHGGFLLRPFVLDRELVAVTVAAMSQEGELVTRRRGRRWRTNPRNPPWTVAAARAADAARGARDAGGAELLHAVLTDPDDTGRRLLREHGADPAEVEDVLRERVRRPPSPGSRLK
ncbi:hypothetical protein FB565_007309 [Actinoplanes lutulentus]|uniref:Clp protease N-terminal domain-containing protein n=1 Tax=Actinoplanes lutulentus TaxID=1287878 RepID=UPI0015EB9B23|nr:Clp protease N-terminal domain-containing protein [Actinoplanes lutulentus]MBB2947538.1 hypothetical protein [Actinoplanes lutulentus]